MKMQLNMDQLGASITRQASLQTYYTVRLLVDRPLVADAYRAYAYFRWLDDWLDAPRRLRSERLQFLGRQTALIDSCYAGQPLKTCAPEEKMLITLVEHDQRAHSGLEAYIRNMLSVMAFDARRRGELVSAQELEGYQHTLAVAVTEALHHFIGQSANSPRDATRYLAAEGAHIVHMLRDTVEDAQLGYFNIPREYLGAHGISPLDVTSNAYREWVRSRIWRARDCFRLGRAYLGRVQSLRCRLAGYAYMARFEGVVETMERDGYVLRREYRDSRGALASAYLGLSVLWSALNARGSVVSTGAVTAR